MTNFWLVCALLVWAYLAYDTVKNDPHCTWFKR
jgi:hypothetical protein